MKEEKTVRRAILIAKRVRGVTPCRNFPMEAAASIFTVTD
jgi:hypothetical protein